MIVSATSSPALGLVDIGRKGRLILRTTTTKKQVGISDEMKSLA
jgi:hypothetical protein